MFTLTRVRYKDILDIDDLEIPANRISCIVGESGSGKTTLLRMLNKLISPDSGDLRFQGNSLSAINSVQLRRMVVMLGQNPAIYPGTVADNLQAGLRFSDRPDADEAALRSALKDVRLEKALDSDAEKMSGGEKQRLALARILLMDPAVLLLDEPSSALDDQTEQFVIERVTTYARTRKKTLVMVTHSKQVAYTFADVLIEMKNGRISRRKENNHA